MNWFKNLNATPRLLLSFGVLIVLTVAISFLAVASLSQADDRIGVAYQKDLKGATVADNVVLSRIWMGRQDREAMLNIGNPVIVAADKKKMLQLLVDLHADVDGADMLFHTPEQRAALAVIRQTLPPYEKSMHDLMDRIDAHDLAGASTTLGEVNVIGKPLSDAGDRLQALTVKFGETEFEASHQAYHAMRLLLLSAALIALVLGIVISIFIARGFSLPLNQTVAALEQVADGDLTVVVDVKTRDEVGRMARALNTALEKLRSSLQGVAESAEHSQTSSRELAAAADRISDGAQQQAASLEETSASLEQITAAVRQTADNARQASQLATGSRESAEQGQGVVSNAIAAMAEINAASAKIADITSTINEIAFQANLLAVNAAVEAARAGEDGRGFAVVATEVRSLAQRSAEAAKEIKSLIEDTLQKVEKGSALVNRSGTTLQGIVASVKRVTDIVGEIAAATSEQSTGVDQVNTAVTQMDHVIQSNSSQTEELAATAQSFADQATGLMKLVSTFTLGNSSQSWRGKPGYQSSAQSHPHSTSAARRPGKPATKVAAGRLPSSVPNGRKQLNPSTVLVSSPAGGSDDASFEEF
jgi:methyl-accepting chemotaxis protein